MLHRCTAMPRATRSPALPVCDVPAAFNNPDTEVSGLQQVSVRGFAHASRGTAAWVVHASPRIGVILLGMGCAV